MSLLRRSAVLSLALGMPAIAQTTPTPQPSSPTQIAPPVANVAALDLKYFKPVSPADMRAVKIADAVGKLPLTFLITLTAPAPGAARDDFLTAHTLTGTDIKKIGALIDQAQDLLTRVTQVLGKGTMSDADADLLVKDLGKASDGEELLKTFKTNGLKFTQDTLAQRILATFMRDSLTGISQLNSDLAKASDNATSSQDFYQARDTVRTGIIAHNDIKIDPKSDKVKPLNAAIEMDMRAELSERDLAIKLVVAGTDVSDAAPLVTHFKEAHSLVGKMQLFEKLVLLKLWQEQHHPAPRPVAPATQGALQPVAPGFGLTRPGREAVGLEITG